MPKVTQLYLNFKSSFSEDLEPNRKILLWQAVLLRKQFPVELNKSNARLTFILVIKRNKSSVLMHGLITAISMNYFRF